MKKNPKIKTTLQIQEVDGEILVLDRENNEIHQLNNTASLIWKLCDGDHTYDEIAEIIVDNYDVMLEEVVQDIATTVETFYEKGFIETVE